ncbi:hypothetical protein LEP1GSC060_3164 [Leptospira weilii serovar Ranarum str. ICFT]|uniref:Uncharacterized protein n=1 Tax=Leptospira weilii serovar Ranarum str. ICFT TaxID=1218598 RepID=N1WI08_9LEPT|nr:hypothetical protein LEP1GSC060_3164 [Leptospira weilii serovar Ranarum str. ICFT]
MPILFHFSHFEPKSAQIFASKSEHGLQPIIATERIIPKINVFFIHFAPLNHLLKF